MTAGQHRGRPAQAASEQASDPSKDLSSTSRPGYPSGLDQAFDNADPWWSSCAATAIRHLASSAGSFDVDHLLDLVGSPPHPAYVGAALAGAWRAQIIEQAGCRVASDGRLIRIWRSGPKAVRQ